MTRKYKHDKKCLMFMHICKLSLKNNFYVSLCWYWSVVKNMSCRTLMLRNENNLGAVVHRYLTSIPVALISITLSWELFLYQIGRNLFSIYHHRSYFWINFVQLTLSLEFYLCLNCLVFANILRWHTSSGLIFQGED